MRKSLCSFGLGLCLLGRFQLPAHAQPAAKPAQPTLEQVLERLNKVEKELETLRKNVGKGSVDKKDQRLIIGLETPYLGSPYYSQTNPRVFVARLLLVNLTDQKITLKSDDVKLDVDGQEFGVKDPSQQWRYANVQMGNQHFQLENLKMPKEVHVPASSNASTWVMIPELPAGNLIPVMKLKIKAGDHQKEIDINAQQRDVLGLTVERIGPGKCLGLLTINGQLNPINSGALADEIDRLASEKTTRIVVRWADQAATLDHQIYNWLQHSAMIVGRGQPSEMQFPTLPATLRELHLANVPNEQARQMTRMRNVNTQADSQRIFATDVEAVVAALQSAYEMVSRDELTVAIMNGNRLEKAAAMIGGGGRLPADKLSLLLESADDKDPVLQQAALTALAHFGEKDAIDKLVAYAHKNLPKLSETAITSLASSRFSSAQEAVLTLLKNEPPEGKKAIVRLLAKYPRPIWSDAIYEFVKGSNSDLGVEALKALVQVGHPQLVSVLKETLKSSQPVLRNEAFLSLSERSDRESEQVALEYALEQLQTQPPTEQIRKLLNRTKDKRALPLLWKHFDRSSNRVGLLQTFALIGDQDTVKELLARYPRLQEYEKGETLRALAKLDAVEFRKLASTSIGTGNSLVNYAVQGLQEDGSPEAIKILTDTLETSSQQHVWSTICNALYMLGTPACRTALIKARDSGITDKRNYAQNALNNLQQRSPGYQYVAAAKNYVRDQKWKEALEQLDIALQMDPSLPEGLAERGNVLLHQEKFEAAGKDFEKCVEVDPYNHQGLTGLCIVMVVKDGKHVEAIKKVEDARSKFGEDPVFRYNIACVYARACAYLQKNEKAVDRDKLLKQYTENSLKELQASIRGGFQDFTWMQKDPDLKFLHDKEDFKKLMQKPPERDIRQPQRIRRMNRGLNFRFRE